MDDRCLYCRRPLSGEGETGAERVRWAFDAGRGRLWRICDRCLGWNLRWNDGRHRTLEALERLALDRGRVLYETDHIALVEAGGRRLVRVGAAPRPEEAWWRYGRRLRRRRDRFERPLTRIGVATYAAVSAVGSSLGLSRLTGDVHGAADRQAEVLRWRRFGATAWAGRAPCPSCNSVLIRLFFFRSPDLILVPDGEAGARLGLPCTRCDPWTVEKTYRFDPAAVEPVLRRVLAWQNIAGASRLELGRAARLIEADGTPGGLARRLAAERRPFRDLGRIERLALEIAVNERAERAILADEAAALEAGRRRAVEVADIIDEELCGL